MCEKPFDPTKPVQTRDGRSARILDSNGQFGFKGQYPIAAAVVVPSGIGESLLYYTKNGVMGGMENRNPLYQSNLVNVPERKSVFVNMYPYPLEHIIHGCLYVYKTLSDALAGCQVKQNGHAAHTLELVFEDGELVDSIVRHKATIKA